MPPEALNAAVYCFRLVAIFTPFPSHQSSLADGPVFGVHYRPTWNPGDEFRPTRDKLGLRQAQNADQEKMAIKTLLNDQVTAWNKGDLSGFMKGYWESDQLTFFSGSTRTSGWKSTLERYRKKYQSEGKEIGHLSFEELSIDFLGPEHALVRGRFLLQMKDTKRTGLFMLILRRTRSGWCIIHDHTSS
ncbi:MAG TPA: nuclear transport factor 2 family protein [Gemmataceae bacterium]|nr:nuclear transport factor 2 family protein [Gemmataceae bacterium]